MEMSVLKMIFSERNIFLKNSPQKIYVKLDRFCYTMHAIEYQYMAGWQSGYAAACKAVNAGSIPASASNNKN